LHRSLVTATLATATAAAPGPRVDGDVYGGSDDEDGAAPAAPGGGAPRRGAAPDGAGFAAAAARGPLASDAWAGDAAAHPKPNPLPPRLTATLPAGCALGCALTPGNVVIAVAPAGAAAAAGVAVGDVLVAVGSARARSAAESSALLAAAERPVVVAFVRGTGAGAGAGGTHAALYNAKRAAAAPAAAVPAAPPAAPAAPPAAVAAPPAAAAWAGSAAVVTLPAGCPLGCELTLYNAVTAVAPVGAAAAAGVAVGDVLVAVGGARARSRVEFDALLAMAERPAAIAFKRGALRAPTQAGMREAAYDARGRAAGHAGAAALGAVAAKTAAPLSADADDGKGNGAGADAGGSWKDFCDACGFVLTCPCVCLQVLGMCAEICRCVEGACRCLSALH
jgi:hypothetical protein